MNNPEKMCACIAFMAITCASQAQGLFDDIVSNVETGTQRQTLVNDAFQQAFTAYARVFTVKVSGKPESQQATRNNDENVHAQVPVTVSVDENAYTALCNDLRKRLEDPRGLNLKPTQITLKIDNQHRDGSGELACGFGSLLGKKTSPFVFCIVERIDINRKEVVVVTYTIDEAIIQGITEFKKNGSFQPNHVRVDILNEKNDIIGTSNINVRKSISLFETRGLFERGTHQRSTFWGMLAPWAQVGVMAIAYTSGGETVLAITRDFPVVQKFSADFSLPREILGQAKSFQCSMKFEPPTGGVQQPTRSGRRGMRGTR
jgi:hypothetical protein